MILYNIFLVDCALQKSKKRAVLLDSWARNFRYLLRTQRKTQNNRKMLKRCDPPAYLNEEMVFRLNFVQYSGTLSKTSLFIQIRRIQGKIKLIWL